MTSLCAWTSAATATTKSDPLRIDMGRLNLLRPNDAYVRQLTRPSFVQIMARSLFGTKPLSEPVLAYCKLDPKEETSVKVQSKHKHAHSRKCIWQCRLQNDGHFVLGSVLTRWPLLAQYDRLLFYHDPEKHGLDKTPGVILGMGLANERRRYNVTSSLIG